MWQKSNSFCFVLNILYISKLFSFYLSFYNRHNLRAIIPNRKSDLFAFLSPLCCVSKISQQNRYFSSLPLSLEKCSPFVLPKSQKKIGRNFFLGFTLASFHRLWKSNISPTQKPQASLIFFPFWYLHVLPLHKHALFFLCAGPSLREW